MNSSKSGVLGILQARMTSSRLPGKVMSLVNGTPMIGIQISRIRQSRGLDNLLVATTVNKEDDVLVEYLNSISVDVYRGSITDVYSRFREITEKFQPRSFLRMTADCPLVMPELIDEMIQDFLNIPTDYLSNTLVPMYPDGLDLEIVDSGAFKKLKQLELSIEEREHVTIGIYSRPELFRLRNFVYLRDLSELRWTVDYPEDLEFVRNVFSGFPGREHLFGLEELLNYLDKSRLKNSIPGTMRNIALKKDSNLKLDNQQ